MRKKIRKPGNWEGSEMFNYHKIDLMVSLLKIKEKWIGVDINQEKNRLHNNVMLEVLFSLQLIKNSVWLCQIVIYCKQIWLTWKPTFFKG